ncbi:MAG: transposase [Caldilineaceae bacterium SB0662_bin_9]|uniref:Transposase n=1 Tax=Caldilineaceae bacterium SB0662_bin_9 TaxID=2605258 RepID=A0A6B1DWE3_9CHLR|nr:transposase [Caldilineaceae bacterium SB0662_bin_9]
MRNDGDGLSADIPFRIKPELALEMLNALVAEGTLPLRWVTCDEGFGPATSRKALSLTLAIEKRARASRAAWRSSSRVQVRAASTALTWKWWRAGGGRAWQAASPRCCLASRKLNSIWKRSR